MPLQQHPVPQHITSYEFRLIGDMTLRQFGWLAGGVILGLIFYSTKLPGFIKWPAILFSVFLGFALAFLPIEERPLATWIRAFFKAVFSPTLFLWQKKEKKLDFLELSSKTIVSSKTAVVPANASQMQEYLKTLPKEENKESAERKETELLKQLTALFYQPQIEIKTKLKTAPLLTKPPIETFIPRPVRPKLVTDLPISKPPSIANIIIGMVLGKEGELIEGAILEIRNEKGIPVRALKTNKLGQFMIATPLENGTYEIEVEKENYQFDIIKIEAKGEIILPIEIRAK